MERYDRQQRLPEVGEGGQQRLAQSRVLVVGAGGLGSTLLPNLAGAGVGYLRIYDPDIVEEHNLHRQTLYTMADIGAPKAQRASQALVRLNPSCSVDAHQQSLTPATVAAAIQDIDLIIDAADSFAVTYVLSDICYAQKKPLISASVIGRKGYAGGFCGKGPSYRAVFPKLPRTAQDCNSIGVMGPAVATLGALQAQMALSVLLDHEPSPIGRLISVDLANWRFTSLCFAQAQEPQGEVLSFISEAEIALSDCVVELRGVDEMPTLITPHAVRISLDELPNWSAPPTKRIVLICRSGVRAAQAAYQLNERGISNIALLAGGR